jgi:hypothetical protein
MSDINATSNGPELPPMALVRVEHYEQLQAELAAIRAERDAFYIDYRERCDEETKAQEVTIEALCARVAELEAALRTIAGFDPGEFRGLADEIAIHQIASDALRATESAGAVQK